MPKPVVDRAAAGEGLAAVGGVAGGAIAQRAPGSGRVRPAPRRRSRVACCAAGVGAARTRAHSAASADATKPSATVTSAAASSVAAQAWTSGPGRLQVLAADRVGGPEGERADRAGRVVAGVLREHARAQDEHVRHVPATAGSG